MPFKNKKQRKLCWYLWNKAIKEGKNPKWDCAKWDRETKKQKIKLKGGKPFSRIKLLRFRFVSSN